jgi:hypothetical protein
MKKKIIKLTIGHNRNVLFGSLNLFAQESFKLDKLSLTSSNDNSFSLKNKTHAETNQKFILLMEAKLDVLSSG